MQAPKPEQQPEPTPPLWRPDIPKVDWPAEADRDYYKGLIEHNDRIAGHQPRAIITLPGQYSDRVKIWNTICDTVAGCTFIVATAWVIISLFGGR